MRIWIRRGGGMEGSGIVRQWRYGELGMGELKAREVS